MKKTLKIIFTVLLFMPIMMISVSAEDTYSDFWNNSGFDEIEQSVPETVKEFFHQNNIDFSVSDWNKNFTAESVFSHIWNLLKSRGKGPFLALGEIAVMLIVSAVAGSFSDRQRTKILEYVFCLIVAVTVLTSAVSLIKVAGTALKGTGTFMLSFIPVFAGLITLSGKATTAAVSSGLIIGAAEIMVQASAFVIVPLMSAYLGVGVASSVSPLLEGSGINETVKKVAMWVLTFIFTIFIGFLSLQTTITASADTLSSRTVKFMVSSFVPVAGSALGEALTTVTGSLSLIKNTFGIYAVIAVCLTLLPIVIELVLWRIVILLSSGIAGVFSLPVAPKILKSVDSVFGVLLGIILFTAALFVISLAVLVGGIK